MTLRNVAALLALALPGLACAPFDWSYPDSTSPASEATPTENAHSASIADVHLEQESPDTATVRTAGFSTRITIDVNPERNLIKQGPRAA